MRNKIKYFINGFPFQYGLFKGRLDMFDFHYDGPNVLEDKVSYSGQTIKIDDGTEYKLISGYKYIIQNYLLLRKLYKNRNIDVYDIVQINNTENFLNFRKNPKQISIAESHGFDFGVNYGRYLEDERNPIKYAIGWCIDKILGPIIRKKIREFDIYYCSTPDMLEPLKKTVRGDVQWLPNPVNTDIFSPDGDMIKLEGSPSFFFPTRLHGDKKPEIAIDIFRNYIKPIFPNATLHLLEWGYEVPKYKNILNDTHSYFWHGFMDKKTLAAKIRGADYCFGDFSIGGLSLMPMQIMACKKPIITYDLHELIKIPREELASYAVQLLEDKNFRDSQVQRNYDYIMRTHSEEAVCRQHFDNLKPLLENKIGLSDQEINNLLAD